MARVMISETQRKKVARKKAKQDRTLRMMLSVVGEQLTEIASSRKPVTREPVEACLKLVLRAYWTVVEIPHRSD
jgi:hypothetical protein